MYEVKYNDQFNRWEVFSERSVIRAGGRQPLFVSVLWQECMNYTARCERRNNG